MTRRGLARWRSLVDEPPMTDEDGPLDDGAVTRLLALRALARPGEDVLGDLIALFRDDARARVDQLRRVDGVSTQDLRRAAHTLKGAASNVGAKRVAELAAALERSYVDEIPPEAGILETLDHELTRAIAALERAIR
jgi:HPt (histidine-containing phosphotransfer) domain-containing protein